MLGLCRPLSPRPSPCGHQSELGAALAGARLEDPPAGQSVVRPRGGGATRGGGGEAASCRDRAARAQDVEEAWLAASQAGVAR